MRTAHCKAAVFGYDDSILSANLLTHGTADAGFRVNQLGDAGELGAIEDQTVEGTDVDTEVAARAQLFEDHRLGPIIPPLNPVGNMA